VVVPAYNEGPRIGQSIARLRCALADIAGHGGVELVVVDDGSSDDTASRASEGGADALISLGHNRGKGAAVRAGVMAARGRTIAFTDADLSYPPEQLVDLLGAAEAGWDFVAGSRQHLGTTTLLRAGRLRKASGRVFNLLVRTVLHGAYRDTQCGMKAFRREAARLLFSCGRIDGFAFDAELFQVADRLGLSVIEVPVTLANVSTSTVRVGPDALRMVLDLFRIRRWAKRGCYDRGHVEPAPEQPSRS
jgi:dolichyl-phosphate beta-glucosyltransferase